MRVFVGAFGGRLSPRCWRSGAGALGVWASGNCLGLALNFWGLEGGGEGRLRSRPSSLAASVHVWPFREGCQLLGGCRIAPTAAPSLCWGGGTLG